MRKEAPLESWYLAGKFDSIPVIEPAFDLGAVAAGPKEADFVIYHLDDEES